MIHERAAEIREIGAGLVVTANARKALQDLGVDAAARVIAAFRRSRFGKEVTDEEIKQALAEEIAAILQPVAKPPPEVAP